MFFGRCFGVWKRKFWWRFAGVWFWDVSIPTRKITRKDSAFRKEKAGHIVTDPVSFSRPCHMKHATYSHRVMCHMAMATYSSCWSAHCVSPSRYSLGKVTQARFYTRVARTSTETLTFFCLYYNYMMYSRSLYLCHLYQHVTDLRMKIAKWMACISFSKFKMPFFF